jgi:hypothetical protein
MFKHIMTRLKGITKKQLVIAGAFSIAMVASISLGYASRQHTSAQSERDCDTNSIDYANMNGGCGALSPAEFIADVRANNPSDLQAIYADSRFANLPASKYDRFASTARMGMAYRNGDVIVDGQTVMTGVHSMGRKSWGNPDRKPVTINGKTYYEAATQTSYAPGVNAIPVMVMFDANGVAESAIQTACGNPVWGNKTTPEKDCKTLNATPVEGKRGSYTFSTNVYTKGNVSVNRVEYDFGDGSAKVVKTSPTEQVNYTYTKAGTFTAKVTVYYNLPGNQVVSQTSTNCQKVIKVEFPFYECVQLVAIAINDKKTAFRFTVKTNQGNGATLKDVDFTLDGKTTTTGVTTEDDKGNIYKEYTFSDTVEHKVAAKANFTVDGETKSATGPNCEAKVTPEKQPVCEVPGKEMFPPNAPECAYCPYPGKTTLPKDSPDCHEVVTPPELPHTGMGSALGLFGGVTAAGAVAHRMFARRKHD